MSLTYEECGLGKLRAVPVGRVAEVLPLVRLFECFKEERVALVAVELTGHAGACCAAFDLPLPGDGGPGQAAGPAVDRDTLSDIPVEALICDLRCGTL